jgi:hypothetical protein
MRRRDPGRGAEPPVDDGSGALTAAELAERFVGALLDHAREVDIDPGDTAAMAALDLICCLAVYGRAPLATVLDTLARAAPVRIALVKDANKRNQPPPPLGVARLGPLVLTTPIRRTSRGSRAAATNKWPAREARLPDHLAPGTAIRMAGRAQLSRPAPPQAP